MSSNQTVKKITASVTETLSYVKKFTGQRILIKLGGSILDDMTLVKQLCEDLSLLRAAGIKIALVHGGSKAISHELKAHKIVSKFHDGQRITTPEMIDIIEMVLCGHVNKMLVRTLNSVGVSAAGLSGTDNKMLQCSYINETLGCVGNIESVNTSLIENFMATQTDHHVGIIPVISPIGADIQGQAMNINADWAASRIAAALDIHKLIYLTDQDGIYDENKEIISELDASELNELIKSGIVKDGMLTKSKTILQAMENNIDNIHIISAKIQHALIEELFTEKGIGTICKKRAKINSSGL